MTAEYTYFEWMQSAAVPAPAAAAESAADPLPASPTFFAWLAPSVHAVLPVIEESVLFADAARELTPDAPPAEMSEEERRELSGALLAMVFVADKPAKLHDLARATNRAVEQVKELLEGLRDRTQDDGIRMQEVAEGWVMRTHPRFAAYVMDLTGQKPVKLSRAQVETLAILAYRQPITRPEIDEIRGVDSGAVLKVLLERDLIRILGKRDEPGRPILYGTTKYFLEFFGLRSLRDMPTLREFTELSDDSRKKAEEKLGDAFHAPPPLPAPEPDAAPAEPEAVVADDAEVSEPVEVDDELDAESNDGLDSDEPDPKSVEAQEEPGSETPDDDDDDDDDEEAPPSVADAPASVRPPAKVIDLSDWEPPPVDDGDDGDADDGA